ncbi:MAG: sulfotransferase [Bryobacteraceae bacterium]|jgi:hypothetical protein
MNTRDYITIVSGVPRSGTSLMMRMLEAGGIPALTDNIRQPDAHNPHGYYEYEPVKRLATDSTWMESARGKAVKIIFALLRHLPPGLEYRVIFMDRDLTEVFDSQREMLAALRDPAASQHETRIIATLAQEVHAVKQNLAARPSTTMLNVPYADLVTDPTEWTAEISRFLSGDLNEAAMALLADPVLYRHRRRAK